MASATADRLVGQLLETEEFQSLVGFQAGAEQAMQRATGQADDDFFVGPIDSGRDDQPREQKQ